MYIKRQIDIYDLKANISKIKELGFQVHLDDFGKAYATLEVLQEIPFDAIKIDRKLISVLETNDQNKLLISYGVDIIQGYLIGKAVSFSEAKLILQK
ncbi:MAG: EAL domain-containing protein [Bacilli bacterium]